MTKDLNRAIERNVYPIKEALRSNMRHRPIGIDMQYLADAFLTMKLPFESPKARQL